MADQLPRGGPPVGARGPPPPRGGAIPAKKYQRGQHIAIEEVLAALPPWYTDETKRQVSTKDNYVVIARNSLSVVKEIIEAQGADPLRVVVAFDIDRTLRMGTSEGIKRRDPQIDEVLESLQTLGVTMLALTGAQADCNPLVQDATQGAMKRISPIGLEKWFQSESDPPKETIVKGTNFQIRYRGRIIVSTEKDCALDYYLCHCAGLTTPEGIILEDKAPQLLIFVDDSDANISSSLSQFSKRTYFPNTSFVGVWFEPTLEMISDHPKEADNHQPGVFEKLFDHQKDQWRVQPVPEVVSFVYKAWGIEQ